MREVPKKNYFIMLIIILSVIAITIVLSNIYNNKLKRTSIMYNYLSEIKIKDIDTYLIEKPYTILYISDKYDLSHNEEEKTIKNSITNYNLKDYFVFLNLNQENIDYIDKLNKKYNGQIRKETPVIVIIEDGKIVQTIYQLKSINLKELTRDIKW